MRRQIPQFKVEIKRSRRPVRAESGVEPDDNAIDPFYDEELPVRDIREDVSYDDLRAAEEALFGRPAQPKNVTMTNEPPKPSDDLEIPTFLRRTASPSNPVHEQASAPVEQEQEQEQGQEQAPPENTVAAEQAPDPNSEKKILPSLLATDPVQERLAKEGDKRRGKRGSKKVDTLDDNGSPPASGQQKKLFDTLEGNDETSATMNAPVEHLAETDSPPVEASSSSSSEEENVAQADETTPEEATQKESFDSDVVSADDASIGESFAQEEVSAQTTNDGNGDGTAEEPQTEEVEQASAPISDEEWEEAAPEEQEKPVTSKPRQPRKPRATAAQPAAPQAAPEVTPPPQAVTSGSAEAQSPAGETSERAFGRPPRRLLYNRWASRELAKVAKAGDSEQSVAFLKPGERWKRRLPSNLW